MSKLLLIDDEEDVLFLTKLNLEGTGDYLVDTASNGEEGVVKAQSSNYDLVITDFKMPDMDGEAVLSALKALTPNTPIILFSIYYDDVTTVTAGIRKKADGLISKPIDKEELVGVTEHALAQRDS